MPSSAVDAFIYVWKMFDQHWAKTKLARACVRNVNYLSLNLLKLFLSHMLWPRTSMSICSYKLGSQGESSKETTNIAMCCSRWCHCHRFQSLQDFCSVFLFQKILRLNREPWLERPQRTRCFLRFAHLGLFLDVLGFKEVIWYLLFASDIFWQCLVVGCFEVFFSPCQGTSLTKPSHWGRPLPERGEPHNGGLPGRVGFLQLGLPQSGHEGVKNDTF